LDADRLPQLKASVRRLVIVMYRLLGFIFGCIIVSSVGGIAQERSPEFSDYPVRVVSTRRSVKVQIHSTSNTVCFRTMLRKVAREGQLFAGHYAIGSWGCGTCLRLGIVDLTNGRAYVTPFEASSAQGIIRVKPNSRLVIIDDAERANPNWYYLWSGRHLLDIDEGRKVARHEREREFLRCSEMRRLRWAAEQIIGRERRERVSQLDSSGVTWMNSRRRVNSTVMLRDAMNELPRIQAEVTFLPESEGGRKEPPQLSSGGQYRPHLVVGDPNQRQPVTIGNEIQEIYLGVAFVSGPAKVESGKSYLTELALLYWPQPMYESLVPNATFTMREGARIIGYGRVRKILANGAA
jgi:hypothetical protein